MPFIPIVRYEADWLPVTNQYRINAWLQGAGKPTLVPINSETEFNAVVTMLGRAGVLFDSGIGLFNYRQDL